MPRGIVEVVPGGHVLVMDAFGVRLPRRAVTGVVPGVDFPIVWLSREAEWSAAEHESREPDATPWPAEDVELADD
jgi:hypothetical protein